MRVVDKKKKTAGEWFVYSLVAVAAVAIVLAVVAGCDYVVMLAWNYVAPLFNAPKLNFWQTVAIVFIVAVIGSCFRGSSKSD